MTRSILFKLGLKGRGIVNFDSNDQKWAWNKYVSDSEKVRHENVSFGKKRWYDSGKKDDNGNPIYTRKVAISSDCLRHHIFIDDMFVQSPNIFAHNDLLNRMIASPAGVLRGYMFAVGGETTLKKKSSFAITEAEQTNGAMSQIETFSRSGKKEQKESAEDTSDTSFFKKETAGELEYAAEGFIDLRELQFISLSELYDRLAVHPDLYEKFYKPVLEKNLGSPLSAPAYYVGKGASLITPEWGVLLNNTQVVSLVRELCKRILRLTITKSQSGYAQTKTLQIKYVNDPLKDKMSSSEGWITLSSESDVQFTMHDYFEQFDEKEARSMLATMDEEMERIKRANKDKKSEASAKASAVKKAKAK